MNTSKLKALYAVIFAGYPDIFSVKQLQGMLGISPHLAYDLLEEGQIKGIKIGNAYKNSQNQRDPLCVG